MSTTISRRAFAGLPLAAIGAMTLSACNSQAGNDTATNGNGSSGEGNNKVKVGVVNKNETHLKLVELAKEKHDIEVELVEFTDYTQPNPALTNGDTDLNWFQHIAYLADYNEASGEDLTFVGTTEIIPLPLYSKQYDKVEDFKDGDTVAIPNDVVNQGRAINMLVEAGLLTLKADSVRPEPRDIDEDASKVKVQPVAAQQTVNALESVQGAVINNTFSADAGIDTNTAVYQDDPSNESAYPYVNGFASRSKDRSNETLRKVAALYHEPEVLEESAKLSSDTSVPVKLSDEEIDQTIAEYQKAIAEEGGH